MEEKRWEECNELHGTYNGSQAESAETVGDLKPLQSRVKLKKASEHERAYFCLLLDYRIAAVREEMKGRAKYIELDCDRFDWFNNPRKTYTMRKKAHEGQLEQTTKQLTKFQDFA